MSNEKEVIAYARTATAHVILVPAVSPSYDGWRISETKMQPPHVPNVYLQAPGTPASAMRKCLPKLDPYPEDRRVCLERVVIDAFECAELEDTSEPAFAAAFSGPARALYVLEFEVDSAKRDALVSGLEGWRGHLAEAGIYTRVMVPVQGDGWLALLVENLGELEE